MKNKIGKGFKYTKAEDVKIINTANTNSNNVTKAFEVLAQQLNRTPAAIQGRYYTLTRNSKKITKSTNKIKINSSNPDFRIKVVNKLIKTLNTKQKEELIMKLIK